LRQTAQRVDAQMESYRRAEGIAEPWAVRERILVCLGDAESGVRLVRAVRRMAAALKAVWIVAHVETPGQVSQSQVHRDRIVDVMGLAEDLGAESIMLNGLRVRDEILAFARARNVSRIVVGKPNRPAWLGVLTGSLVNALLHESGDADVYVLRGEDAADEGPGRLPVPPAPVRWRGYAGTFTVVGGSTLLASLLYPRLELSNLAMIYLLGVVVCAVAFGRGPAMLASLLAVASFDFLFVPPRFNFRVSDTQYLVTFGVMLVVAAVIGTLTARLREQAEEARLRARRSEALHDLSRELAGRRSMEDLLGSAVRRMSEVFDCRCTALLPGAQGRIHVAAGDGALLEGDTHEQGVAQWVFDHAQPAGLGTATLPGSRALHLPLVASGRVLAVIALQPADPRRFRDPERQRVLSTFVTQVAIAVERALLAEEAERSRVEAESERTRNALLSSVSHDLRTPLAVIAGAASSLREGERLTDPTRRELAGTIVDEAARLNRLVGDLLDMTKLESGAVRARKEWHSLEEVVGAVRLRTEALAAGRAVTFTGPPDLPLVPLDDVLYAQALTNVLENALLHSPPGAPVELTAQLSPDALVLEIRDHGPGLPEGGVERVFEKFWRGNLRQDRPGAGLGLTIARAIAEAHGGTLTAANHPQGGATFRLSVPMVGVPPSVERDAAEGAGAAEAGA
jgi:two-component system sensor histidine kinase KdpD